MYLKSNFRFTEEVKIRAVEVIAESKETRPEVANLFINENNIDFDIVDEEPVQSIPLSVWTEDNQIQVTTRIAKFVAVQRLIIHFKNENERLNLRYICVRGIRTKAKMQVVHAQYEKSAMLKDHDGHLGTITDPNAKLI